MKTGALFLIVFMLAMVAGGFYLWKKGYLKSLFTPSIPIKAGMKILWCDKDGDNISESIVTAASPSGKFIKLDDKNWIPRGSIVVRDILERPQSKVLPVVKELPYKLEPKKANGGKSK